MISMRRRRVVLACALLAAVPHVAAAQRPNARRAAAARNAVRNAGDPFPTTGQAVPELAAFDREMTTLMQKWGIPGAELAVLKDGRLVLARGYGWADVEAKQQVQPENLFRIASVTKPITATAILKLSEEGKLDLDAKAFDFVADLAPPTGSTPDKRLKDITIRELLYHEGGWDRDSSYDAMFISRRVAKALAVPMPPDQYAIIRYMKGQPLDFTPGTRYAYSNFGYAVLGRVVEKVTGQKYEQYVAQHVLAPMGITRMRIGHSRREERLPGEVAYYDLDSATSVRPQEGKVPGPYALYIESLDSHGGWIASAVDLARFLTAMDGLPAHPDFLRPKTLEMMLARPTGGLTNKSDGKGTYYAMGWSLQPGGGYQWHNGGLPGTASEMSTNSKSGVGWAVLFNARYMTKNSKFEDEYDAAIVRAAGEVKRWPAHDLFSRYR